MSLFSSFFIGGFECSTHVTRHGQRLDMLSATLHDQHLARDYSRLLEFNISTVREGIRWHVIERTPGRYDFSSARQMIHIADEMGIQVIWDLMHFGYPDHVDIYSPRFITQFAAYAREFVRVLKSETDATPFITPINEISFFAFHGGEIGDMNPFSHNCGDALKAQLVRATIAGIEAIRAIAPDARFVHTDPWFNTVADSDDPAQIRRALAYSDARYQAWDMLAGYVHPELGGGDQYLDIVALDYYPWNQQIYLNDHEFGDVLDRDDPRYIPIHRFLRQVYERYHRPLMIGETSTEDDARAEWCAYVSAEVSAALTDGVPIEGVCLYPIVNFPGWDNGRLCQNGLWGFCDEDGERPIYEPMAHALREQQRSLQELQEQVYV